MVTKNKFFYTVTCSIVLSSLLSRFLFQVSNNQYDLFYPFHEAGISKALSSNQAFIFLDSSVMNINHQRNKSISQEIIINGIENRVLKQRLLELLNIDENSCCVISKKKLALWISRLKLSGFFTSVTFTISTIQNHQVIQIHLSTNPVLRQISIIEYSKKIIPYSYLLFIFRNQVGYPISFNKIDESLNLIRKWYHKRGYKWATTTVIKDPQQLRYISIDIKEGIISRIEFVSYNHNMIGLKDNHSIPVALLLGVMQIYPLQILNINHLEQGILSLKKQKLILHCHYEISWSAKIPGYLSLLLKVESLDQRSTYLFNKNISLIKPLMESIELFFKYSLGNIFENSKVHQLCAKRRSSFTFRSQNAVTNGNNILYSRLGQEYNYFRHLKSQRLLRKNQCFNEWHTSKFLFIVADHLGFRHYIKNLAFKHSHCFFDVSFPGINAQPYFKLQYELPWISKNSSRTQHIIGQIFRRFFDLSNYSKVFPFKQLGNSYFCYQESLGHQMGLSLELINNNNIFTCDRKIIYTHVASKYLHTHNYIRWSHLGALAQDSFVYAKYPHLKSVWTHNLEQATHYNIHFTYYGQQNRVSNSEIYFDSMHLIPQGRSRLFHGSHNGSNYSNKTSIGLDKICRLKSHKIHYTSELAYFFGNREYLPPSQEMLDVHDDIVRGYSKEVFPFPLKFGKINLEYHIPFSERNTVFCFANYSRYIVNSDISWKHNLCISQFRSQGNAQHYNRFSCGLGLHISIPIRQIPPLRLEYSYNINHPPCLHLRVYK